MSASLFRERERERERERWYNVCTLSWSRGRLVGRAHPGTRAGEEVVYHLRVAGVEEGPEREGASAEPHAVSLPHAAPQQSPVETRVAVETQLHLATTERGRGGNITL